MNIGEKIRNLRTSKFITQAELAGDKITRNMLSLIESGNACPSVQTIIYIANKLGVPAGYLLAEENEEPQYMKMLHIADIKRAFSAGDFRICRDICLSFYDSYSDGGDDEVNLILAECSLKIAVEEFFALRIRRALKYFEDAIFYATNTIYYAEHIIAVSSVYSKYIGTFSPTLYVAEASSEIKLDIASNEPFCKYILALDEIEKGDKGIVDDTIDELSEIEPPLARHLRAKIYIADNDYESAYKVLLNIFDFSDSLSGVLMYHIFCDLETVCREMGDYKGAYEYSSNKVEQLEKLLSED